MVMNTIELCTHVIVKWLPECMLLRIAVFLAQWKKKLDISEGK